MVGGSHQAGVEPRSRWDRNSFPLEQVWMLDIVSHGFHPSPSLGITGAAWLLPPQLLGLPNSSLSRTLSWMSLAKYPTSTDSIWGWPSWQLRMYPIADYWPESGLEARTPPFVLQKTHTVGKVLESPINSSIDGGPLVVSDYVCVGGNLFSVAFEGFEVLTWALLTYTSMISHPLVCEVPFLSLCSVPHSGRNPRKHQGAKLFPVAAGRRRGDSSPKDPGLRWDVGSSQQCMRPGLE